MSSYGPTNNVTAIETDMRDVLRERKARLSDVTKRSIMTILSGLWHIGSIGSRDRSSH